MNPSSTLRILRVHKPMPISIPAKRKGESMASLRQARLQVDVPIDLMDRFEKRIKREYRSKRSVILRLLTEWLDAD